MGRTPQAVYRAALLCLAAVPAFAAQVLDPAAARRATMEPAVIAADTHLSALAASGQVSELSLRIQRISTDRTLAPAAREWLLDRGLHQLAALVPTAEAHAIVQQLAGRRPEVFTLVDPDHGDRATPLYDTGATARFVLRAWERRAARLQAETDLAAGRTAVLARFAARSAPGARDPAREGIAEAFAAAPRSQLVTQRNAIHAALSAGERVDELALLLAGRLADTELARLVVDHAEAPVALAALRSLPSVLDPPTAREFLVHASRRAEIASAATLAIGRLANHDGAARAFLYEQMDDPILGPSAAAALASIGDPAVASELGRRLRAAPSEPSRRMHVLALRLDGSPAAREELRRFAAAKQGSAQLRQEVEQWLER
jgi:hypothetical protein